MKIFLIFLVASLIVSCTAESPSQKNIHPEVDEIVDLRIYSNGHIRFNGAMITESSLFSQLANLRPSKSSRARIIFDETAPTGVVHKTQRLLYENKITNIYSKMLSGYFGHTVPLVSGHIVPLSTSDING